MKTEYLYTDLFNLLIEGLRSLEPSEEIAGEAANVLIEMKTDIASLKQQLAEAKKDAERYRWLRKRGISLTGSTRGWRSDEYLDKHIDAAIDQAMREGE